MIRRLYVNNFRCLENFDLPLSDRSSSLLIGKNGAGKSAISYALEILQSIARGVNRTKDIVKPSDFSRLRSDVPIRIEIEVILAGKIYIYTLAFELPAGLREVRVSEEKLSVDSRPIYSRELSQVKIARTNEGMGAGFSLDWHLVALPVI